MSKVVEATHRVPDGKTVRVCVQLDPSGIIEHVVFTGDFFLEPADLIDQLAEQLHHVTLQEAEERIRQFFEQQQPIFMFGVRPEDFVIVLRKAVLEEEAS